MKENPQRNRENHWRLWEWHLDEVMEEAHENPTIKVPLPVQGTFVIHDAREISEK